MPTLFICASGWNARLVRAFLGVLKGLLPAARARR